MNDNTNYPHVGIYPHANRHTQDRNEAVKELQAAIGSAQETLISATTVFPFTLFPDTITVDRSKLTVAHRIFFSVAEVISVPIKDILNVVADVGPLFGSIKISTRFFDNRKPYAISYLWRSDALRIKRVVQGALIAAQKEIDCSTLSALELATMFDELGKGALEQ